MSDSDDDRTAEERDESAAATQSGTASETTERETRDPERTETAVGGEDPPEDRGEGDGGSGLSGGVAVAISAVVALVVTALTYLWASGWFGGMETFYENLFRVAPTVSGGGVGADWVTGNTVPWLDAAIAITHAADVIMGVFILVMVFIHWAIFRRLSTRMRQPTSADAGGTVATDGGTPGESGGESAREDERGEPR